MIPRVFPTRPSIPSLPPPVAGWSSCTPCTVAAGHSGSSCPLMRCGTASTFFFADRVEALERAGIARERLIIDPGMGFFLSSRPEASLRVLTGLDRLKAAFDLQVLISVSRKSFLRAVTGRAAASELAAASLAAELYAAEKGADYIRTHDPGSLADGLKVMAALHAEEMRLA